MPPVADAAVAYAFCERPSGNAEDLILNGRTAAFTSIESDCEAYSGKGDESVTFTENENCPVCEGMPESTPLVTDRMIPGGSCPVATLQK
jgi:hypothetical protein